MGTSTISVLIQAMALAMALVAASVATGLFGKIQDEDFPLCTYGWGSQELTIGEEDGVSFDQWRIKNLRASITLDNQVGDGSDPFITLSKVSTDYETGVSATLCGGDDRPACQKGKTTTFSDSGFQPGTPLSRCEGLDLAGDYLVFIVGGGPGKLLGWTLTFDVVTPAYSCGGHTAKGCSQCPFGEDRSFHGRTWCNGECVWERGSGAGAQQCRKKKTTDVNCGLCNILPGFFRPNCSACADPSYSNPTHCSGDCKLDQSGQCLLDNDDRRHLLRGSAL